MPHGVDNIYSRRDDDFKRESFLLSVSDIYVQKNFTGLVQALGNLRENIPDICLKIGGSPVDDEYFTKLKKLIQDKGLENNIEFLGHVSPSELKKLYQRCCIFVFPSTVETFGNPLVEAMACGAPIASSNTAAMPEVLGKAAAYFNPNDVADMTRVLQRLYDDPEERLRLEKKSLARASSFVWEETKRRTIEIIRSLD